MTVWIIDSVEDRPDVTLSHWAVFEVPLNGPDQPWSGIWQVGRARTDRAKCAPRCSSSIRSQQVALRRVGGCIRLVAAPV